MIEKDSSRTENVALKSGIWYVVSSVVVKAVSIITTPVFTRLMTPDEYGVTATFTSWYALLLSFCTMNLSYSIGRAKLDFPKKLDEYIGAMQLLSSIITTAFILVCCIFLEPLSEFLGLGKFNFIMLLCHLFFAPAITFAQNGYRYKYQYKQNIAIAWYTALSTVAVSLILLLSFEGDKSTYRITGIVFPTVLLSFYFWIRAIRRGHIHYNQEYWKYGLVLSSPLILHTISINILSQSDRIFISKICGTSATGIYSLAQNYATMISMVTNAIAEGWLPWFHDNYFANNFKAISKNVKWSVILGCYIGLACIAFAPEAIVFLGGEGYAESVNCVPPIVLGIVCQCIYTHYVNIEMHLKKTKSISGGTILAAILNIILNMIFIPIFGYVAASYTTLVSYIALLIIHYFITRKLLHVKLYDDKFMFASIVVTVLAAGLIIISYKNVIYRYTLIVVGFISFMFVFKGFIISCVSKFYGNVNSQ